MKKIRNIGMIKRDLSFPIFFQNKTITASPGDTLASAILSNSQESLVKPHLFNDDGGVFLTKTNELNFKEADQESHFEMEKLLHQEVHPYLSLNYSKKKLVTNDEKDNLEISIKSTKYRKNKFSKLLNILPISIGHKSDFDVIRETKEFADVRIMSVELLVVGSGISGLVAALASSKAGLRVLLLESDFILGGRLNSEGKSNNPWLRKTILELKNQENICICTRTQLLERIEPGFFVAVEKSYIKNNEGIITSIYKLIKIKAKHTFICTGAKEIIPPYLNRNLQGIMSSTAFRTFLNRFGLGADNGVTLYTNNDAAWKTVTQLTKLGLKIDAVIDTRIKSKITADCLVFRGAKIVDTIGKSHLRGVIVRDFQGRCKKVMTSFLAVSGGYKANLTAINDSIQKLKWCLSSSSFIVQTNTPDLTLLGGANSVYCPNLALKNAYLIVSKFIKSMGKKFVAFDLPNFELESYEFQLIDHYKKKSHQNPVLNLINENVIWLRDAVSKKPILSGIKNDRLNELKLDALKTVSNDKKYIDLVYSSINEENVNAGLSKIALKITAKGLDFKVDGKNLKPFRALPGHSDYEKLGAKWKMVGEWVVPEYFLKDNIVSHKRNIINFEVKTTIETVGISDISDQAKIEIQGKDAKSFIQEVFDLKKNELKVNKYSEGMLKKGDNVILDEMAILSLGYGRYLLTTSNYSEKELYDYLITKFSHRFKDLELSIHLVTDFHQVYALWGPLAGAVLEKALSLGSSLSNLKPMEVRTINYQDSKYVIFRGWERSIQSFKLFVISGYSTQVFHQILKLIHSHDGLMLGRSSCEIIGLENGHIPAQKLRDISRIYKSKESIGITNWKDTQKKIFKFECFNQTKVNSNLAILKPLGPTKNIVEGSDVASIEKHEKNLILGKVLTKYFSPIHQSLIAYVFLKYAKTFTRKTVMVLNENKNYQTKGEMSNFTKFINNDLS